MSGAQFPPCSPVTPEEAARNYAILEREVERAHRESHCRDRDGAGRFAGSDGMLPPEVVQIAAAVPEPLDFAAGQGIPPAARAALMAAAKARLVEFAIAVRSRNAHMLQHVTAGMSLPEWEALAIAAVDAADPARLLVVARAADDGLPAHLSPEGRASHAA